MTSSPHQPAHSAGWPSITGSYCDSRGIQQSSIRPSRKALSQQQHSISTTPTIMQSQSQSQIFQTFTSALSTLYGPLSPSSLADPSTWVPPQKSGGHKGRYLWTDAFGVLALLTLHAETNRNSNSDIQGSTNHYLTLAARLIDTVHNVLGRHRSGTSFLPGASESNPVGGGLRIGKMDDSGSDGDGQYHHYLTLWMFALNRMSMATKDPKYNQQAIALAKAIHGPFFINRRSDKPRMVWKMTVDLSKPLVASEGNLDPIDGFVMFRLLQATACHFEGRNGEGEKVLRDEIEDYARVMKRKDELLEIRRYLDRSMKYRLAFREFGTALGLRCMAEQEVEKERAVDLRAYSEQILNVWRPVMEASLSDDATPEDLRPITRVMYAAALIPGASSRKYWTQIKGSTFSNHYCCNKHKHEHMPANIMAASPRATCSLTGCGSQINTEIFDSSANDSLLIPHVIQLRQRVLALSTRDNKAAIDDCRPKEPLCYEVPCCRREGVPHKSLELAAPTMRGRRICQEESDECESKPDPAEFDEEEVEDVVFAGEVVDRCRGGGGHGVIIGFRIPGDRREDRE
ncbi:predicted protein [Aspergillus nidulans FGSC A4]|nr:predicted protein [Aspergillus nidulans FGSC A4]|eukprot:XP_661708.1 predicted protein [Aspergillus nidulans FGSC A4]